MDVIIGFIPTNKNTLNLLRLFYSDNEIITMPGRPAICTLIDFVKSHKETIQYQSAHSKPV